MDLATIIGIIAGVGAIVFGILVNGSLQAFIDYPSLAIVLGGTAGNFLDRIFRGNVVDFLHFYYRSFDWLPAFNVADSAISTGVALFIFSSLYHGNKQTPTPSNP